MTRAAIQRPVSTLVLALGLAVFGFANLLQMPVDFLPDVTYPLIKLSIEWPGATPEDIDRSLADPIERQLASVDGLDFLSSSSLEGLYQLDVNFRYGVDADTAYQDTLAAFARAQRDLPEDSEPAVIIKADPSQLPIVLAVQFNSLRLPLVVLLAAPFCLAGIGYGLFLGGQPFGVTVVIALLVVLAANVNDAVLLIETAERHRADGRLLRDAVHSAALLRLRPRLMTTLPIILGFLPLALALEPGTELLQPMATAAIGGLLTEVFVALLLVPVLYTWVSARHPPCATEARPALSSPSSESATDGKIRDQADRP
jgi:multidrug efflux pump subunit AcrB